MSRARKEKAQHIHLVIGDIQGILWMCKRVAGRGMGGWVDRWVGGWMGGQMRRRKMARGWLGKCRDA